jgi:integrase
MLQRRGESIGVRVHAHMFRHGFADAWLNAGGDEGDLQELAGWKSSQMVRHYAAANRPAYDDVVEIAAGSRVEYDKWPLVDQASPALGPRGNATSSR